MDLYQQKAFSLVELLCVVAILAILLSLATPSFSSHVARQRDDAQVSLMLSTLNLLRSEAIKRTGLVTLCVAEPACNSRVWQDRVLIFHDRNQNGWADEDEPQLHSIELDPKYRWHWSNFRQRAHLAYQPNGMTHALNGTLTLCEDTRPVRQLVINLSGRVRQISPVDATACAR